MEQNIKLLKSTIRGLNYRYNTLKKLNELTGESESIKGFLDKTLGVMLDIIGAQGGTVFLYQNSEFLNFAAFRADLPFAREKKVNFELRNYRIKSDNHPAQSIIAGTDKFKFSDTGISIKGYRKTIKEILQNINNTLTVAIRVNNKKIGFLEFYNIPQKLKSDKNKFLLSIGGHIGASVELFKKLDSLKSRTFALKKLASVTELISSSRKTDELLKLIQSNTKEFFNAEKCYIFLKDEPGIFKLWRKDNKKEIKNIVPEGGILSKIINTGSTVMSKEQKANSQIKDITGDNCILLMGVSLKVAGETTGLIVIARDKSQKPFKEEQKELLSMLASHASIALNKARLFSLKEKWLNSTVNVLVETIKTKNKFYHRHIENSKKYLKKISDSLNLSPEKKEYLLISASIQEIGKLSIPENVLQKQDKLSGDDWKKIKKYPLNSVKILENIEAFKKIIPIIKYRHEHYDGTGYPEQLSEEKIPRLARILSVVDAYVSMRENRPYREALPKKVAIQNLKDQRGSQFDPRIVDVMIEILEQEDNNQV